MSKRKAKLRIDSHLMDIMKIQSKSRNQYQMTNYILQRLSKVEGLNYQKDSFGNITVTKGVSDTYICLCCHQDTVHPIYYNYNVKNHNGNLYAYSSGTQVGIGGDDKCGVYVSLHLLENCQKPIKVAFFTDEEIGCVGSSNIDHKFFNDVSLLIGIDRRGDSDLITHFNGQDTISEPVRDFLLPIANRHKYFETTGMTTDVFTVQRRLMNRISAINVSCGFFNPHSDLEYVSVRGLYKCIGFLKELL